MATAFVKDLGACIRAGYPIVTIVTPVLERRLQRNQRTPGIGLVRFLGPSDEQPFAAIAVDWGGRWLSSAMKSHRRFFSIAVAGSVPSPESCRWIGLRIVLFEACSAFTRYGLHTRAVTEL